MDPLSMLVGGGLCAIGAAGPMWLWLRRERELVRLRKELVQARRTIQSLHKQMGLTTTQYMPLPVSQRIDGLWRKG